MPVNDRKTKNSKVELCGSLGIPTMNRFQVKYLFLSEISENALRKDTRIKNGLGSRRKQRIHCLKSNPRIIRSHYIASFYIITMGIQKPFACVLFNFLHFTMAFLALRGKMMFRRYLLWHFWRIFRLWHFWVDFLARAVLAGSFSCGILGGFFDCGMFGRFLAVAFLGVPLF